MIHTMQLFNFFKSSFKNLMNLPSLHIQDNLKRKIPKNQLINQLDQITFVIQAHLSNSPWILPLDVFSYEKNEI